MGSSLYAATRAISRLRGRASGGACAPSASKGHGQMFHVRYAQGDTDDPFRRGYLCPKAPALADLQDEPDRLRSPLVREASRWREVSWDEAWDRAADGLVRVRKAGGRDAVAVYYGNPVAHNLGLMTHALPFGRALRTCIRRARPISCRRCSPRSDVRASRPDSRPRSRPDRLLPDRRRQPRGVEQQSHDRPEHDGRSARHSGIAAGASSSSIRASAGVAAA